MSYTMQDFRNEFYQNHLEKLSLMSDRELLLCQLFENYREEKLLPPHTISDFLKEFYQQHLKEILQGFSTNEVLKNYSPDERLQSLSIEEIKAWLETQEKIFNQM